MAAQQNQPCDPPPHWRVIGRLEIQTWCSKFPWGKNNNKKKKQELLFSGDLLVSLSTCFFPKLPPFLPPQALRSKSKVSSSSFHSGPQQRPAPPACRSADTPWGRWFTTILLWIPVTTFCGGQIHICQCQRSEWVVRCYVSEHTAPLIYTHLPLRSYLWRKLSLCLSKWGYLFTATHPAVVFWGLIVTLHSHWGSARVALEWGLIIIHTGVVIKHTQAVS